MDASNWNRGLMLASLLIVIAGMKLVAAQTRHQRLLAAGMAMQAIVLAMVFNGAFFQRSELTSVAIALVAMLGLWCLMSGEELDNAELAEEDSPVLQRSSVAGVGESTHPHDDSSRDAGDER
jgi:hypothetical protein